VNSPEDAEGIADFDDWDGYVFDTSFFQQGLGKTEDGYDYDEGDSATFRIQRINDASVLYLRIYNHHNGYYGHGFDFQQDDEVFQSGTL
jgi:hypothetical protein